MTKNIENGLEPLMGYLLSIKRNTVKGWYELEVGLHPTWIFKGNKTIECETIDKNKSGILIKVYPKVEGITIDDLVSFVQLVILTNSKIAEKEKEFNDKMDQVKNDLESQAKNFYKELEDLREKSFGKLDSEKNATPIDTKELNTTPKRGRGRPKGSPNKKPNEQKVE